MATMTVVDTLVVIRCAGCSVHFAFPKDWQKVFREDGRTFYCPVGCRNVYRDSDNDRLARELAEANDRAIKYRQQRDATMSDLDTVMEDLANKESKLRRVEQRLSHGVCPCCNRSFTNLEKHMGSKHPNFGSDEAKKLPEGIRHGTSTSYSREKCRCADCRKWHRDYHRAYRQRKAQETP